MYRIWKKSIAITDTQDIYFPEGSEILCVQMQGGRPCVWALVKNELAPDVCYKLDTFGTGHSIHEDVGPYIGTYQLRDGELVFHVFHYKHKGA